MTSAPIAGWNTQIYIASGPLTLTNEAMTDSSDHTTFNDTTVAHQCWNNRVAFVVQAEWDELQSVTITGSPTGGTFVLRFGGQNTAPLNWNCTASQMQTALQNLSSILSGNALVTGGPGPGTAFTVEFTSSLGYASQALITLQTNSLTGGSSPNVAIARVQAGQGFTTQSGNYTINYPIGQIVFASDLLGTPVVRVSSGGYLPASFLAWAKTATPSLKAGTTDVTSFVNPPSQWKQFIGNLLDGDIKLSLFWIDATFLTHMTNNDLLIIKVFPGQNANQRYQGYGILNSDDIKADVTKATTEDIDFTVNGQLYFIAS